MSNISRDRDQLNKFRWFSILLMKIVVQILFSAKKIRKKEVFVFASLKLNNNKNIFSPLPAPPASHPEGSCPC
jgi:hypothetical protein